MPNHLKQQAQAYFRGPIGFSLFLAWNYLALYGCGIAPGNYVHNSLEYIWMVAGLAEAVVALVGLAIARKSNLALSKKAGIIAAVCAGIGSFALWLSYFHNETFWITFIIAGIFCGIALALMVAIWGSRLSCYDEAEIEFSVLVSFVIAFALYCILLPIPLWGALDLVAAILLPIASMAIAFVHNPREQSIAQQLPNTAAELKHEARRSLSVFVMLAALWFEIAYFRVLATPDVGNRYTHYLIPFASAFVVTMLLFALLIRVSRYLNFTLAFRWSIPFMLLGFGLLYSNFNDTNTRIVAYGVNFIGMFGMQISYWIAIPKFVRRTKASPLIVSLFTAASEGIGIGAGCAAGLYFGTTLPDSTLLIMSMFFAAGVAFVAMLVGFNPKWLFFRNVNREEHVRRSSEYPTRSDGGAESEPLEQVSLEGMFLREALRLQSAFGLTERETEVAALLLAGRSRPYIRDELVVSLNTVHAHARNIFAKCEVHSQQEFMDLARLSTEQGSATRTLPTS